MKPKIMAEVAQGYEGRPDYALFYVKAAHKAGADAVKFQIVFADDTAEPGYEYYEFYKQLEMSLDDWLKVRALARELGVGFFADISGDRALEIARQIVPDGIKIHSSNFFNRNLIRSAFDIADKVFLSLGGVTVEEIDAVVEEIETWGTKENLVLLYGFQAEPTPIELSNIGRIPEFCNRYEGLQIGYMDHTPGDSLEREYISIMAMMAGVDWLEKHITIDRFMEVEDFVSALEPVEFKRYVQALEHAANAIGAGNLDLTKRELEYRDRSVKKLITARKVQAGTKLKIEDIAFKRTARIAVGEGFHDPATVVDRIMTKDLDVGMPILEDVFK